MRMNKYLSIMRQNKNKYLDHKKKKVMNMNDKLIKDWGFIKNQVRVVIHVNSMSYDEFQRTTTEKLRVKMNSQIMRIFQLKDPNLEVILVIPKKYSDELINYYYKILDLNNVYNYKMRLHFIHIDLQSRFDRMPLIDQLYYDSQAQNQIKKLIYNKTSYLYGGFPSMTELKIAYELKTPILTGDPMIRYAFNLKNGTRKLLDKADVPIAPGSGIIHNENQLYDQLSELIHKNMGIQVWRLKVVDEF